MKPCLKIAPLLILMSSLLVPSPGRQAFGQHWWNKKGVWRPPQSHEDRRLPLVSVRGNRFVNARGDTLLFRGLSIADPDKLEGEGHWKKELFEKIHEMGAQIVRVPVHPIAWRERTPSAYLTLLDSAVAWCSQEGMYAIIDWHSIGNLETGLFQSADYTTTKTETFEFWHAIARHFRGNNTVAFYEIFNEPTTFFDQLGPATWESWRKINEDVITLIRAFDRETIPLVAGFDWAYDLTPLRLDPVHADGIGYVSHPYPEKRSRPWPPKWDVDFGFAAAQYPLVATEIGYMPGREATADYPDTIINYLEERGISWVAWVYDPQWVPSLIKSWDTYAPTQSGEFFKKAMHGEARRGG